jgi:integrase/recombinase XerD
MAKSRKAPPNTYWRDGRLWGRITVKGREIRFSLRTDDAEVAASRVKARREREVAAAHFGDQRPTWEDGVLAWGEHIAASVKPSTAKRYAVSLKQLEPFLLGLYLDEIDKGVVSEIVRQRRAKGATNATIRRDLVALSSVLGYSEEEGWRDDNPALTRLRRLKERHVPIELPEHGDIARVSARAPGLFGRLIEAALLTGCRQDELRTLTRRQIDHARRQITLYRTKSGRPRAIDLFPAAYALFQSLPVCMTSPVVFWHGNGKPYEKRVEPVRRHRPVGTKVGTGSEAVPVPRPAPPLRRRLPQEWRQPLRFAATPRPFERQGDGTVSRLSDARRGPLSQARPWHKCRHVCNGLKG